jgi:hypothetical protein
MVLKTDHENELWNNVYLTTLNNALNKQDAHRLDADHVAHATELSTAAADAAVETYRQRLPDE